LNYYEARKLKETTRDTFISKLSRKYYRDEIQLGYSKLKSNLYSDESGSFVRKHSNEKKDSSSRNNYFKFSHDKNPFSFRRGSNDLEYNDVRSNGKNIEFQYTKDLEYQISKIQNYNA
jgi:hypothetical protein